ncbi:MAG TPA: hypothetical protein VGY97_13470 [Solirubrobacteraceae bacterium]|jgi:osmotically inducible protein OsmC|nr:hypothetical protein [Solirubrobacteraceae bacterium]
MEIQRHATLRWLSSPPSGRARLAVESGVFTELPLSVAEGEHPNPGETTPGELLAAAHCAFLAVAVAERLARDGTPATELTVDGTVSIDTEVGDQHVESINLGLRGRVPGLDAATFTSTVEEEMSRLSHGLGLERSVKFSAAAELLGPRGDAKSP